MHAISVRAALRPEPQLQALLQMHVTLVAINLFVQIIVLWSILVRWSSSPVSEHHWDYLLGPSAASLNSSSLNKQVGLISLPAPGGIFLNCQLSLQSSPTCSWSSPSLFQGITNYTRLGGFEIYPTVHFIASAVM